MALSEKYKTILDNAVSAIHKRTLYAAYPEHPKAYGEEAPKSGQDEFNSFAGKNFTGLLQDKPAGYTGEEVSPYTMEPLNIKYPVYAVDDLIARSEKAFQTWKKVAVDDRANVLVDSLERMKNK